MFSLKKSPGHRTRGDNYDNGANNQLRYIDPELKEFAAASAGMCAGVERMHVFGSTFNLSPTLQGNPGNVNSSF